MRLFLLSLISFFLISCAHRHVAPGAPPVPWTSGNEIVTLIDGQEFYPAMLTAIRSAKKSITFETFAYVDSPIATRFTEALVERAVAGVKVHLILDQVGSRELSPAHLSLLRRAGAEVHLYRPFNWLRLLRSNNRTHRKILIIDGQIAFTGGAGIADAWEGKWRDTQYQIRGPAIAQLQESFSENWEELTGKKLTGHSYFPKPWKQGRSQAKFISDTISNRSNPLAQGVLHAINSSQKSLLLEQSYFVPNQTFRKAFLAAAQRGVHITILMPGEKIDSPATRYASQNYWRTYLKANIRLYQYQPAMMHGKLLIADDVLTIIGSGNIDDRSFFLNDEVNLHVRSKEFALEQKKMFQRDLTVSQEITLETLPQILSPWPKRFFSGLISSQL